MVRIETIELFNFKNVGYGKVDFVNHGAINSRAELPYTDIAGIYGQNGSGKTALVEAIDIIHFIQSAAKIPFQTYQGILREDGSSRISVWYFIWDEKGGEKYRLHYDVSLRPDAERQIIALTDEGIRFWKRGASWKAETVLAFQNSCYDSDDVIAQKDMAFETNDRKLVQLLPFLSAAQPLAVFCAANAVSVFFNSQVLGAVQKNSDEKCQDLWHVLYSLWKFASVELHVIKVSQLGIINQNEVIPLNLQKELQSTVMKASLPLFSKGQGELPEDWYGLIHNAIESINIASRSLVPDLQIEMDVRNIVVKEDGNRYYQVDVFSVRGNKKILICYESEGIKRIVSLLDSLISAYNHPGVCLVVDELDSGIFEFLLGELLGFLHEGMKGQLIFTSHNLRILEKLESKNIICSTANPNNRYITLSGVGHNNNRRDFYIRSLTIGGQKEVLYDDDDLLSMGYAFRKAGRVGEERAEQYYRDSHVEQKASPEGQDS